MKKTNFEYELTEDFNKWFTMPLDGFPKDIRKIIKDTALLSFKKGGASMFDIINN